MTLTEHGTARLGELIDRNVDQALRLAERIRAEPRLSLVAPTTINIVCFRYDPGGLDEPALQALNTEIMLRLQEEGTAAISDTTVAGRHCLRLAICNHRTRTEDLDLLLSEVLRLGAAVLAEGARRLRGPLQRAPVGPISGA
jgi:glutamate/tyrosine decarboxylase-like PLP-dependent enzyme